MELNERIIQARKQAGLTQEQLGEKLGVSRQAVSKWESGQANPDVGYVAEMCRLFDVSSDWLLLGKEDGEAPGTVCPGCGALLPAGDAFCSKCGVNVKEGGARKGTFCLYLASNDDFSWQVAKQTASLFHIFPWAKPAFPWDGGAIDENAAHDIVKDAPLVLCRGLTYEQAVEGAKIFCDEPNVVEIYRDEDVKRNRYGRERPEGEPYTPPPVPKEPMSPGMVFLMVVLGVIAAIFLLSIF